MSKNTSELLLKFDDGKVLTTMELTQLSEGLSHIASSLRGHGDLFKPTTYFVTSKLNIVDQVLSARMEK